MKKQIVLIALVCLSLSSCKKDSPKNVSKALENGTWKITLFQEDTENKTTDYNGDRFTFNSDGTVKATHSATDFSGTWKTQKDSDHTELVLNFMNPSELMELSDDWHIIENTDKIIKLHDESGDGTSDYLTFEKI